MSWIRSLWPRKLLSQMIILVLLALVLAQGISVWILSTSYRSAMMDNSERYIARQYASIVVLLEQTPDSLHANILRAWRRPGLHFSFESALPAELLRLPATPPEKRLHNLLLRWLGDDYRGRIRIALELADNPPQRHLVGDFPERDFPHHRHPRMNLRQLTLAVRLDDGRWFLNHMDAPDFSPLAARHTLTFVLVASVLVLLVLVWQLRKITRPLSHLARAANDLGRGKTVAPLQEEGPADVRDTVVAFNRMNDRLQRFVSDRTRMLAALSHDLRTPMTSMRLRLELMAPGEERDKLLASLEEMQLMSEATLDFVRQSGDVEETRSVDVSALIDSLCEDLVDLGMAVEFTDGDRQVVVDVRPVSLKRALRNLIENAVKYGGSARVTLRQEPGEVMIEVRDAGPGIPIDKLQSVFEPFVRVEQSRSRDTGGMGLGLSIARQIIVSHGGDITLTNQSPGLLVCVHLPN